MPVWVWIFLLIFIGYGALVLRRAWAKRIFKYGPVIYSLKDSPTYFWFFAFTFTVAELFLLILFGLAVVSAMFGPVFHSR